MQAGKLKAGPVLLRCAPAAKSSLLLAASCCGHADLYANCLASYAGVAHSLIACRTATYQDALQQQPATQQAVLSVLLDRCLPLLAANCSPETLADFWHPHYALAFHLGHPLASPCLASELRQRMQQPQAFVQQALQVTAALPLQRSPGAAIPDTFGGQHAGAVLLLGTLCFYAPSLPAGSAPTETWQLEAVPRMTALLVALAADSNIPTGQLAQVCFGLHLAAGKLLAELPPISSDSQLAAWAAAADAALRAMPALLQLHERCQSFKPSDASGLDFQQFPMQLARALAQLLPASRAADMYIGAKDSLRQPLTDSERLLRQLWALHNSMCRLVAWVAADPTGMRAAVLPAELQGTAMLNWLDNMFFAVLKADRCNEGAGTLQ